MKNLHAAVDQIQVALASPDLNRLSLREQLTQRQVKTLQHLLLCIIISIEISVMKCNLHAHLSYHSPCKMHLSLISRVSSQYLHGVIICRELISICLYLSFKRLLVEMEGFKHQVLAVQQCQSALRLPEEVLASLPICRTAQTLQQEASQLQHTTIQQCNILQVEGSPYTAHPLSQKCRLFFPQKRKSYEAI